MSIKRPLEKDILAQCRDYLRATGWLVIRLNSGAATGEHNGRKRFVRFNDCAGLSDLLAIKNGVPVFIEVKRPGCKPTKAQDAFLDSAADHGASACVVRSLDELIEDLAGFKP